MSTRTDIRDPQRAARPAPGHGPTRAIREVRVTSLGALVDELTPEVDRDTGHRRALAVYRGCRDASSPLLTSLDRLAGVERPHAKSHLEPHLFRSFARYARAFVSSSRPWELLATAQHHGVPTRLLDWTVSPLIAAHFATLRPRGLAVVIWRLDWRRVHERFELPDHALTIDEVEGFFGEVPPFDEASRRRKSPIACLLEPPSFEPRIVAQAGAFTVCSDTSVSFDDFLARHGLSDALTRFVIEADDVPMLRDQLDLLGVDERRIFPDLDGVAAAIRRYYE
ncbi:MAG: FRG domain-containing protein [Thermodesulfobacteriota bacterium]